MANNVLTRMFRSVMPYREPYVDPDEAYNRKAAGGGGRRLSPGAAERRASATFERVSRAFTPPKQGPDATPGEAFLQNLKITVALARDAGAVAGDLRFVAALIANAEQKNVQNMDGIQAIHDKMVEKKGWRPAPLELALMHKAYGATNKMLGARPNLTL